MSEHEASPEENRIIALLISDANVLVVMAYKLIDSRPNDMKYWNSSEGKVMKSKSFAIWRSLIKISVSVYYASRLGRHKHPIMTAYDATWDFSLNNTYAIRQVSLQLWRKFLEQHHRVHCRNFNLTRLNRLLHFPNWITFVRRDIQVQRELIFRISRPTIAAQSREEKHLLMKQFHFSLHTGGRTHSIIYPSAVVSDVDLLVIYARFAISFTLRKANFFVQSRASFWEPSLPAQIQFHVHEWKQ